MSIAKEWVAAMQAAPAPPTYKADRFSTGEAVLKPNGMLWVMGHFTPQQAMGLAVWIAETYLPPDEHRIMPPALDVDQSNPLHEAGPKA